MKTDLVFMCLTIVIIHFSTIQAKGGRGGGGRSGGRSSGGGHSSWSSSSGSSKKSGGSSWNFFGSGSKSGSSSVSSSGSKNNYGGSSISSSGGKTFTGTHSDKKNSGGWFSGLFHSTPYHYTYRPTYIGSSYSASDTAQKNSYDDDYAPSQIYPYKNIGYYAVDENQLSKDDEKNLNKQEDPNTDNRDYAVGYTISKALNSDFFSIFNVVHDISKYPEKIKNKEFVPPTTPTISTTTTATTTTTTTTTEVPDTTNTIDFGIKNPYLKWSSNIDTMGTDFLNMDENLQSSSTTETTSPTYDVPNIN